MPIIRTKQYKKLTGLEDERNLDKYSAPKTTIKSSVKSKFFDITGEIPGTLPEKMIYNYLKKLKINFEYQYHMPENVVTLNPESNWIPDFKLPDHNGSMIEVYGTYWHRLSRTSDQVKKAYWLLAGYTVVEKGVQLRPTGLNNGGKVVIWWENEIYLSIDSLVARDLPELMQLRKRGTAAPYLQDPVKEKLDISIMRARMKSTRIRPKYVPKMPRYRKLVRKKYDR